VTSYVWDAGYIDSLISRSRDDNGAGDALDANETLFYMADANYNVTGLVNASGQVVERYLYDAYGRVTYLNPNFTEKAVQESAYENTTLYTGRELDPETGLMYYRARYYHTDLGRFTVRDPIQADGNLYRYCRNSTVVQTAPTGLQELTAVTIGGQTVTLPVAIPSGHEFRIVDYGYANPYVGAALTVAGFAATVVGTVASNLSDCSFRSPLIRTGRAPVGSPERLRRAEIREIESSKEQPCTRGIGRSEYDRAWTTFSNGLKPSLDR
jgi:RHS repeat-associated protein